MPGGSIVFQSFLVPTDGSELSQRAIGAAVALAAEVGARLIFFHALPDLESSIYGEAPLLRTVDPEIFETKVNERASAVLERAASVARAAGVASESACAVTDQPYEGIISAAKSHECDLILMASHGYRGVKGLLLGSQTQKVLSHSTIPVLVYR
jgi:nucleotide-binding universal stress UspA family protein